jgi:hypothetical protein
MRFVLALAATVAIFLLGPPSPSVLASSSAAVSSSSNGSTANPAVERLGACMALQRQADVLLMIDTSGSLASATPTPTGTLPATDPTAVRVTAARYLTEQLAQSDSGVQLDVAVAGFDVNLHPSTGWTQLSPSTLPGLDSNIQTYAAQHDGVDTDYATAFSGALAMLRAHNIGGNRCQAIVWFTDGQFSIQPRQTSYQLQFGTTKSYAPGVDISTAAGVAQASREAETALCQPGGIMDQMRAANIETLAVGLGVDNPDFSLMQSMATGSTPNGTKCGTTSSDVAVGSFTLASNVDDIVFAFDTFADPHALPSQAEQAICELDPCSAARNFVLDSSIRSVHVLADTTNPGVEIFLTPPGAASAVVINNGSTQVANPAIPGLDGTWVSNHLVNFELTQKPGAEWAGKWSVVFVDPTGATPGKLAKTSIRIRAGLIPTVLDGSSFQLRSGTTMTVHFGVIDSVSNTLVTQVLGSALLTARLVPSSGSPVDLTAQTPISQLSNATPINLAAVSPGTATIEMELDVTTKSPNPGEGGTALSPELAQFHVTVLPPLHFPTVSTHLDFGHGTGTGTAPLRSRLAVTGPGCVWVGEASIMASPVKRSDVTIESSNATGSSAQSCLHIGNGQNGSLPLRLRLSEAGSGVVAGDLKVHLVASGAASETITEPVSFIGDVSKPVSQAVLWSTFVLALLLGLALPVAFLYLARYRTGRIPAGGLLVADIPVDISGSDVTRDRLPLSLSDHDFHFMSVPRATRELAPLPGVALQTRTPLNPVSAGYVLVTAPGFSVVTPDGDGRRQSAVHGTWMVLLAEPRRLEARLVLLLAGNSGPDGFSRVVEQVRTRAPSIVAEQRRTVIGGAPDAPASGGFGFDDEGPQRYTGEGSFKASDSDSSGSWGEPDSAVKSSPSSTAAPSTSASGAEDPQPGSDGGSWW